MADKEKSSLSTMAGSGVLFTTSDGVRYRIRGLKIKWHDEYMDDDLFVSADKDKGSGYFQYSNIADKEKRKLLFKWFNRLVFNQTTGKPMTKEEFNELEYDDIGAILLKIMRLSD